MLFVTLRYMQHACHVLNSEPPVIFLFYFYFLTWGIRRLGRGKLLFLVFLYAFDFSAQYLENFLHCSRHRNPHSFGTNVLVEWLTSCFDGKLVLMFTINVNSQLGD